MKIRQHKSVFAGILLCSWLLGGCEKEVTIPDLEGDIIGYLLTFNEFGLLSDHSDVKITTRGYEGSYTAYSDVDGRYEFRNLPVGTYDLVFSKEGYVNDTLRSVRHLGGKPTIVGSAQVNSIYTWTRLYKIPEVTIQNITYENGKLVIDFNFPGTPGDVVWFMLYFSDQSGFLNSSAFITSRQFTLEGSVYVSVFSATELPFEEGNNIYVKASGLSDGFTSCATINEYGNYEHCDIGVVFYPILGDESNQFTLVFPG